MARIGYALSSEEHAPAELVDLAAAAEECGFDFAMLSDHFHPWTDRQGQSPFAWSILGAIGARSSRIRLGTGVTCPTMRYHPAIVAQAAATTACLLPGRFFLGLGSGEKLNEHIFGAPWPSTDVRLDMLRESVEVIRGLWQGRVYSHRGTYFTVDNARLYTLPDVAPDIYLAAGGPSAAELAGEIADGVIGTSPEETVLKAFREASASAKPRLGQITVCWATSEADARRTALEWWPNAAIPGELGQELPMPAHFEQAASLVDEETLASSVVCGPDPEAHLDAIRTYLDAGYDQVYLHQVGPDQGGFFDFCRHEVLPRAARL